MIIDKKGKLFGKINIVDLCVILVVIIGVVGVIFTKAKLSEAKVLANQGDMLIKSSAKMDKMEAKLEVKEVRDVTRDAIIVGDEIYLAANDKKIGTVARVESKPAVREVISDKGYAYLAEVPERFDVTIVVEVDGKKKEDGYYTDSNIQLLYGKELEIKTTTVQTMPTVKEITVTQ